MRGGRGSQLAVIGAGAAGLYTALCAARAGASVTLVSATPLAQTSSYWAQGGLAAALGADDSPERHLRDTLAAGRGAVRESAARLLCEQAPLAVEDLARLGVRFDADRRGRPALGLEGGHSARRVVHAGGAATGRQIVRRLAALATAEERITVLEGRRASALLIDSDGACCGVMLDGGPDSVSAPATVLATGGAAALWARSTNPPGATGGGLLLAHRAGAALADLELMQFHPTAVVGSNGGDGLLVSEAVRGEGARLLDCRGERFVDELAPRDEVARAVLERLHATGTRSVSLDMRDIELQRFASIVAALREAGIDPARELVPVAPAAHYMMGGIAVDLQGRSSVPGLYAVGECSDTGLHGANRLASNSLSECFVFGARAAVDALAHGSAQPADCPRAAAAAGASTSAGAGARAQGPSELSQASREALWRHAGLERDEQGLTALLEDPHPLVGLIARCALARRESRGAHWRRDFPATDQALECHHVVIAADGRAAYEIWR